MEELRIPKRQLEIETVNVDGVRRQVIVYLSEFLEHRAGGERVSDLLNSDEDFFPVVDKETNATLFLAREGLMFARVRTQEELTPVEQTNPLTEHCVDISLSDGAMIKGVLAYLRQPERARVVDVLNEPGRFLPVRTGDFTLLINKRHIVFIGVQQ